MLSQVPQFQHRFHHLGDYAVNVNYISSSNDCKCQTAVSDVSQSPANQPRFGAVPPVWCLVSGALVTRLAY